MSERPLLRKLVDNRVTRRLRPGLDRFLIARSTGMALFENLANRLPAAGRDALFWQSGSGEHAPVAFPRDEWRVDDGVTRYRLPLRREHARFDWAAALGALGHDAGIKAIYKERTLEARRLGHRVRFVDVGANFGWHSFWHLGAGHEVVAFEPNPRCRPYFEAICARNGWRTSVLHSVAVGATAGEAELWFPPGAEWLGTLRPDSVSHADTSDWSVQTVPVISIDALDLDQGVDQLWIKVDTEGHEIEVIRGAMRTLSRCSLLFFESWPRSADREAIFATLSGLGFELWPIDHRGRGPDVLDAASFVSSRVADFVAIPKERASQ